MEGEVASYDSREQDGIALRIQYANKVVGVNLIWKRVIQKDGLAILFFCNASKQCTLDALAV